MLETTHRKPQYCQNDVPRRKRERERNQGWKFYRIQNESPLQTYGINFFRGTVLRLQKCAWNLPQIMQYSQTCVLRVTTILETPN